MRIIALAAFIIFTIFAITLAISNQQIVTLDFAPFPLSLALPAFMLVFGGILIGLGGGWIVSINTSIKHAARQRKLQKRINALEKEQKSSNTSTATSSDALE